MKKYIKTLFFNKKSEEKLENRTMADFFLNATDKERERVFLKAAKAANEDQRKVMGLVSN